MSIFNPKSVVFWVLVMIALVSCVLIYKTCKALVCPWVNIKPRRQQDTYKMQVDTMSEDRRQAAMGRLDTWGARPSGQTPTSSSYRARANTDAGMLPPTMHAVP